MCIRDSLKIHGACFHIHLDLGGGSGEGVGGGVISNVLDVDILVSFVCEGAHSGHAASEVLFLIPEADVYKRQRLNREGYAVVFSGANDIGQGCDCLLYTSRCV